MRMWQRSAGQKVQGVGSVAVGSSGRLVVVIPRGCRPGRLGAAGVASWERCACRDCRVPGIHYPRLVVQGRNIFMEMAGDSRLGKLSLLDIGDRCV